MKLYCFMCNFADTARFDSLSDGMKKSHSNFETSRIMRLLKMHSFQVLGVYFV